MTPKQMALSRLARLALNAASDSTPQARAEVCQFVGTALADDCPDLSEAAIATALRMNAASESEQDLLLLLDR